MKINMKFITNIKTKEVMGKVNKASKQGLRDTVVDIANDAIKESPKLTGNNARSIRYEVGPGEAVAKKEGEGAIYSTSGYGGYLETGTVKMPPRPYFKSALDRNVHNLPSNIKTHLS